MPPRATLTKPLLHARNRHAAYVCHSCRSKLLSIFPNHQWRAISLQTRPHPRASLSIEKSFHDARGRRPYSFKYLQNVSSPQPRLFKRAPISSKLRAPSSISRTQPGLRFITTTADVTDVNPEIPYNAGKLHKALSALEQDASTFVDLSQLRLVLRGLESKDPVTRVASKKLIDWLFRGES